MITGNNYFPYGKVLREYSVGYYEGNRYLTTAHERDKETGLDYRGARYYDSDLGRFLSLDPLAAKYPTLTPYNYVAGMVTIATDPTGKEIIIHYSVTEKDEDGNDVIRNRSYTYGSDVPLPDNEFVQETVAALDYLVNNGLGNISKTNTNIISEINNSTIHNVNIYQATITNVQEHQSGDINFNPRMGLEYGSPFSVRPPAFGLLHELGHAYNYLFDPVKFYKRVKTILPTAEDPYNAADQAWDNEEERYTILRIENPALIKMNFNPRKSHRGSQVETLGPTSSITVEQAKKEEIQNYIKTFPVNILKNW